MATTSPFMFRLRYLFIALSSPWRETESDPKRCTKKNSLKIKKVWAKQLPFNNSKVNYCKKKASSLIQVNRSEASVASSVTLPKSGVPEHNSWLLGVQDRTHHNKKVPHYPYSVVSLFLFSNTKSSTPESHLIVWQILLSICLPILY